MKKITLLLLFMSTFLGYAQIKNYTFSQSAGYFTPISGGTLLGDAYTDDQRFLDPNAIQGNPVGNTGVGLPIGFNFVFNGYSYDRFAISANGWISLGSSALSPSVNMSVANSYGPLSSTSTAVSDDLSAKICALGKNLQGQTGSSLRFQAIGDAPNRTLVVQWLNYRKSGNSGIGDSFSFQIRLNETSNTVDIVYDTCVSNATPNGNYQVGMRAEPAAVATNFVCRTSASGWDYTDSGDTADATVLMTDQMTPYSGLTYTWTPPACGGAKRLVASSITTNSASLSWGSYQSVPSGYEYVVSTSAVLPTGSGTSANGINIGVSNLSPSTLYNVFLRIKCGSAFSQWVLAGSFKTKCPDALSFTENFDSYPSAENSVPNCWTIVGNGAGYVYSGATTAGSAPNRLYMYGDGNTTIPTVTFAISPPVSNLQSATYRLRFKAYTTANATDSALDVGYFTNIDDVNTFISLQLISLPSTSGTSVLEYTIVPPVLPVGIKNLVFKNRGKATGPTIVYIDDVNWEPKPTCPNIGNLSAKGITSNSVNLSWTAGGSETAWQYVYGPSSVADPSSLAPVNATTKSLTINGLSPSASYKVWVRSACDGNLYGVWVGPFIFTTYCASVTEFSQSFDAGTAFPSCWNILGSAYGASIPAVADSPSAPNSLGMYTTWDFPNVVTVMQPVSNFAVGSHRLRFKFRGTAVGAKLDLGYLTDAYDANSFVLIQSFYASSTTSFDEEVLALGSVPASPFLAFRVSNATSSTVYIDDVFWEPIPTCHDITGLSSYEVTSSTVSLDWTAGGMETGWQYVLGTSTTADPNGLIAVDVASNDITVSALTPDTSYKIWVRSRCSSTNKGAWVGPVGFATTCAPVTYFAENFDASTGLPSCWKKVGLTGSVFSTVPMQSGVNAPSGPNVLILQSSPTLGQAIVAMMPVSNSADGKHRLRFKFSSTEINAALEVGFMTNLSDPSTFASLKTFTSSTVSDFENGTAELGLFPTTEVLAFRNAGSPSSIIFIDDVFWEPIPACAEVTHLVATEVSSNYLGFSWDKGGSENGWQYVIGAATDKNPDALTPVAVTKTLAKASGLAPVTSYKIWVRSKCGTASFGTWVGPIISTTSCAPVSTIAENFDAGISFPSCWAKIGTQGSAYLAPVSSSSTGSNILYMYSSSPTAMAVVGLPGIDNTGTSYLLKFKLKTNLAGAGLEVGYLTNVSDPSSFISFKSFTAASTTLFEDVTLNLAGPLPSQVLAFRNSGIPASAVYIDDVSVNGDALGIDAFDLSSFSFHPNPVKDVLNISLDKEINDVAIINLLGQQLMSQSNNSNQIKIDMSGLSVGTYFVKVTSANRSRTIKVIKG